ncbi:MAG: hypothetical protein V3T31_03035, partial [candidate division Zixibacteria bacterium]
IANADVSNTAAISPSKIQGTAATWNAVNYFATTNHFNSNSGRVQFFDSTLRVNNEGIVVGRNVAPTSSALIKISRYYNTSSHRYGLDLYPMRNSSDGHMYGAYIHLGHTTGGTGGRYGAYITCHNEIAGGAGRYGVFATAGNASNATGSSFGVRGNAYGGVYAYGIYGLASSGSTNTYAGYFSGDVNVTGSVLKSGGSSKIDHPLDPANKYLFHSNVESPDMMNVYNGNVELDAKGEATVRLPDYFDALNKDFRYQLTSIGAPGPNLYIAEKINGLEFRIAGGEAFSEVSWQVTGVRKDAWAEANRTQVEVDKPALERGYYIHPEVLGLGREMSIDREELQKAEEASERRDREETE